MGRTTTALSASAVAAGLLLGTAGAAHRDDASYLHYLADNGLGYYDNAPSSNLAVGRIICDNLRFSGNPRAAFSFISNAMVSDQLINAAQQELCPDTLASAAAPAGEVS